MLDRPRAFKVLEKKPIKSVPLFFGHKSMMLWLRIGLQQYIGRLRVLALNIRITTSFFKNQLIFFLRVSPRNSQCDLMSMTCNIDSRIRNRLKFRTSIYNSACPVGRVARLPPNAQQHSKADCLCKLIRRIRHANCCVIQRSTNRLIRRPYFQYL